MKLMRSHTRKPHGFFVFINQQSPFNDIYLSLLLSVEKDLMPLKDLFLIILKEVHPSLSVGFKIKEFPSLMHKSRNKKITKLPFSLRKDVIYSFVKDRLEEDSIIKNKKAKNGKQKARS